MTDGQRSPSTPPGGVESPVLRLVAPQARSTPTHEASHSPELSPALEDVIRKYGDLIRRTAHRHQLSASDMEDVVQETRIRLWKALITPERIREAPATYVYRTAVSSALDFLRRRRAKREVELPVVPHESVAFIARERSDHTTVTTDIEEAVVRAVNLLVESRRAVVRMYLAGYDRDEIATLLKWSDAKTRNLLYRGLADVRETLESWGYGPGATE